MSCVEPPSARPGSSAPVVDLRSWSPPARLRVVLTDLVLVGLCFVEGFTNQSAGWNRPFLLSVLALLAVAGRRLDPGPAFVVGMPALGWAQSDLAVAVLTYTLARRERRERRVVPLLLLAVVVNAWPLVDPDPLLWRANAAAVLQLVTLVGGAAAVGALVRVRGDLRAHVAELDAARRREAAAADAAARTQERTRVAREMHDVVSHQVSLIAVAAGALRVGGHPPAVTSAAETIRQLAVRTSDELRAMLLSLRSTEHDPRLEGLPGLGDLGELWARTGLDGSCDVEGRLVAEVPVSVQHQLFRVVQEALTNVHRHAPGALTTVTVAQDRNSGELVVGVLNAPGDGPSPGGARIGGSGHGILGMHERVGLVGGRLRVGPTSDGGFEVVACVPPSAAHRG